MKNLTKSDIENRFINSNVNTVSEIIDLKKPINMINVSLNKMCRIVIPGEPIVDGRIKYTKSINDVTHTYNPNKQQLMKVFKHIYDSSDILHGLIILGPIYAEIDVFVKIPKTYLKYLNKKDKQLLAEGKFIGCSTPDVDNIEKINYDILQDTAYGIILRDEMVIRNQTTKYFVSDTKDCKVEIRLFYNDTMPRWCREITYSTNVYLKYKISMKYKLINNIPDGDWQKIFFQNIINWYKDTKKNPVNTVKHALKYYSKSDIDLLYKASSKEVAINIILDLVESLLKMTKEKK